MSWVVTEFWVGLQEFRKDKRVKLVNPDTDTIMSLEQVIAELSKCVTLVEVDEQEAAQEDKPAGGDKSEENEKPEVAPAQPKKRGGRPKMIKPVDTGKIKALAEARWSVHEIASDMGVSEETVREVLDNDKMRQR